VPIVGAAFLLAAAEAWLLIEDVHATPDIWRPPGVEPITVLPAQPLAAASTATLREQTLVGSPHGFTETLQAARAQFGAVGPAAAVQVVEQWELAA
jgi:hypothetical protein